MAGILGGLQSLHTDAYDEALSCPTEFGARIAVATQNILREEAHLTDVIDPLGGSYYVETLTDQMEAEILRSMRLVEDAGGMYAAVEAGLVQQQIGESARAFQDDVESGGRPWSASTPTGSTKTAVRGRRCEARLAARCRTMSTRLRASRRRARRLRCGGAGRAGPRGQRPARERLRASRRGGRSRLHARRNLRDAAPRDGLRRTCRRRVKPTPCGPD